MYMEHDLIGYTTKKNLSKFKRLKSYKVSSLTHGIKPEIKNSMKTTKFKIMWKLNNALLNIQWIKE